MNYPWHLYVMAALYIFAGIMHFIKPKAYLPMMPPYFPAHKALVFWSGVAEILLGIGLCFEITKNYAIHGIITMLTLFFSVHLYMLSDYQKFKKIPRWLLILRIPLQLVLIYWAYIYLKL